MEGSEAPRFRSEALLYGHFDHHGRDMGFPKAEDYEAGAQSVILTAEVASFTRPNGDVLYYRYETNEFVVVSADNVLITYFMPKEGQEYWLDEIREYDP